MVKRSDANEMRDQGLENRLSSLESEVRMEKLKFMMARIREKLDLITNKKEYIIVITGMTCNIPMPENFNDKK